MQFEDIIIAWRAAGRTADAIHADEVRTWLMSEHSQVYSNLNNDNAIDDASAGLTVHLREELLNQLLTTKSPRLDPVPAKNKLTSFFQAHQELGNSVDNHESLILGHVFPMSKLEKVWIRHARLGLASTMTAIPASSLLTLSARAQKKCLRPLCFHDYNTFSFYRQRLRTKPFQGVSTKAISLRRRLGLGESPSGESLVWFSHQIGKDGNKVRNPTALDAGWYEFYRPGGRTRPLYGTGGLPEAVHPPVHGKHLQSAMRPAT